MCSCAHPIILHDFTERERILQAQIADLKAQLQEAREVLGIIRILAARWWEQELLKKHGYVFGTPFDKPDAERTEAEWWEKLAFSLYTDLAQIAQKAEVALEPADD